MRDETKNFLNLPRRCQELLYDKICDFADLHDITYLSEILNVDYNSDINSPIEIIFYMVNYLEEEFCIVGKHDNWFADLDLQYKIKTDNKTYIVDFCYFVYVFDDDGKVIDEFNVVVECDGHHFHEKTKEQVAYGNERDLALRKAGYEVIHFSGSQIYKEPYKCLYNVYDFIETKVNGR